MAELAYPRGTLDALGEQRARTERWRRLRPGLALLAVAGSVFGGWLLHLGFLDFPLYMDEVQFWEQSRHFAEHGLPSLADFRSYAEPMTPGAFLAWAAVERATGAGIVGGRLLTLLTGILALLAIAWQRGRVTPEGALAACGLLAFPYFSALSLHLYTDVPAALLAVLGLRAHWGRRFGWAALAFALAISTRQYMIVFPMALMAERGLAWLQRSRVTPVELWAPALGAAAMVFWVAVFGGPTTAAALERYPSQHGTHLDLSPSLFVYFFACVGAYFVVPELLLFQGWRRWRALITPKHLAILAAVALVCWLFPPLFRDGTFGPVNRAAHALLPELLRALLLSGLAIAACVRFARLDLSLFLLLGNLAVFLNREDPWEKYLLAMFVALWALRAAQASLGAPPRRGLDDAVPAA